uniref:Uncharacterized protein n=1 Tax=viral metagenome TaxID=1070528 RepID=A0A6H1ZL86_9ZZZZ
MKDFYVEVENKDQANEVKRLAEGCGLEEYETWCDTGALFFYDNLRKFQFVSTLCVKNDHHSTPTYSFSNPAWRKLLLPEKYAVEVGNWEELRSVKKYYIAFTFGRYTFPNFIYGFGKSAGMCVDRNDLPIIPFKIWQELTQETTMKIAIRVHDRKQAHALDALLGGLISNCPWALIAGIYLFPDRKTVDWNESDDTNTGKLPSGYTYLDFVTDMPAIVKFFAEGEEDKPPLPEWQELTQENTMKKIAIRVHDEADLKWVLSKGVKDKRLNYSFPFFIFCDDGKVGDVDYAIMYGYTLLDFRDDMPAICKFFERKEDKPPFEKIGCMPLKWVKEGIEVEDHIVTNAELEAAYYYQCCRDAMYEGIDFCFYKNEKGEASFDSNIVKPCDFLPLAKALLRLHWENEQ